MSGMISIAFCEWLLSPSSFSSSSMSKHVSVLHFFLLPSYSHIILIYHLLFICSSVDEHMDCFCLVAIMNNIPYTHLGISFYAAPIKFSQLCFFFNFYYKLFMILKIIVFICVSLAVRGLRCDKAFLQLRSAGLLSGCSAGCPLWRLLLLQSRGARARGLQ